MVLKAWAPDLDFAVTRNGPYFLTARSTRNPKKYEKNRSGRNPKKTVTRLCKPEIPETRKKCNQPGTIIYFF